MTRRFPVVVVVRMPLATRTGRRTPASTRHLAHGQQETVDNRPGSERPDTPPLRPDVDGVNASEGKRPVPEVRHNVRFVDRWRGDTGARCEEVSRRLTNPLVGHKQPIVVVEVARVLQAVHSLTDSLVGRLQALGDLTNRIPRLNCE